MFQVIYSSVIVFTALLSRLFLRRYLNLRQWLSILLITIGLAYNAIGNKILANDPTSEVTDVDSNE
jgi:drug/metabolite transporter (DMT)-like permease